MRCCCFKPIEDQVPQKKNKKPLPDHFDLNYNESAAV